MPLSLVETAGVAFLAALAVGLAVTPLVADSARRKGLVGRDVNKPGKPSVAQFGGFALYGGLASGVLAALLALSLGDPRFTAEVVLLAGLASLSLLALIGAFDDLFKLSRRTKILLPVIGALPLLAVKAGETIVNVPFLGAVDFGLAYTFVLIPLGVTGAANAVNMQAGYNGLEAGAGAIASAFLLAIALHAGSFHAALFLAALLGACLAFLRSNWFPAKIFPSDIGTYVIGGTIAAAVIIGNLEKFGVLVLLPAFYELAATTYYSIKGVERRTVVHNPPIKNGKITPRPETRYYTLAFLLAHQAGGLTEQQITLRILLLYALSGLLALAAYWLPL